MDKALWFCVTLLAMAVIAESRPYGYSSYGNNECNRECSEKTYQKLKEDAQSFLNQVSEIINNVLKTSQDYINEMREQRHGRPHTVIVGAGHHNNNKVVLDGGKYYKIQSDN